jgi:hypothetical protein
MAHEEYGERTNIVVTTNFDDLMADSLYLLTKKKPPVVVHESLAPYVRPSRSRPLIVKLHDDARLAPRNTPDETANLDEELRVESPPCCRAPGWCSAATAATTTASRG